MDKELRVFMFNPDDRKKLRREEVDIFGVISCRLGGAHHVLVTLIARSLENVMASMARKAAHPSWSALPTHLLPPTPSANRLTHIVGDLSLKI